MFRRFQTGKTKLNRTPGTHDILARSAIMLNQLATGGTRSKTRYLVETATAAQAYRITFGQNVKIFLIVAICCIYN